MCKHFKVDSWVGLIKPVWMSVCTSVRPRSFSDFNEIWWP